jgi:hypothetical protein
MKKTSKKSLKLSAETIRKLQSENLQSVAGGGVFRTILAPLCFKTETGCRSFRTDCVD